MVQIGMRKVPGYPRLYKRDNSYVYRYVIPVELRPHFAGKTEIKKSLRTESKKEAVTRWAHENDLVDRLIADAKSAVAGRSEEKRTPNKNEAWTLVRDWYTERLEKERLALQSVPLETYQSRIDQEQQERDVHAKLGKVRKLDVMANDIIDFLCERAGLEPPAPGSSIHSQMADLVHRARADVSTRMIALMQGDLNDHPAGIDRVFLHAPEEAGGQQLAETVNPGSELSGMTIREAIEAHHLDPGRTAKERSRQQGKAKAELFAAFVGEQKDISLIGRDDLERFRDLLLKLPAKAIERFPDHQLTDIPAANASRPAPYSPMARKTAKINLEATKAVFNWLVQTDRLTRNPAKGVSIHVGEAEEEGGPFEIAQLEKIFHAPLYTGCKDDIRGYATRGDRIVRRGRYWIPLIALFSGMRMGEICQLWSDDVMEVDGVWCIRIRASADRCQSIKNSHSARTIPIHRELMRIGFVDWCKQQHQVAPAPLFRECLPANRTAPASTKFSGYFTRFLKSVGLGEHGVVFHSFRHTFRTALHECGLDYAFAREYGGWRKTEVQERYLSGTSKSLLKERLDQIRIVRNGQELSLDHLPLADR